MDFSVVTVNLSSIIGSNFTNYYRDFCNSIVMGITTLYDKYKGER